MARIYSVHPENPPLRQLQQLVAIIEQGGVVALPTDSSYALCCHLDDKAAVDHLRRIRGLDDKHLLTLLCRDLSDIAHYAKVDNQQYRWLKAATPGPFTFILAATKEVPRRVSHPSRKTIGLRVPAHHATQQLLATLGQPLLATSLILPGDDWPLNEAYAIQDALDHQLDGILDAGPCGLEPTTVVDLSELPPRLIRHGLGDPGLLGLSAESSSD
ncbi:L-threonylcarbamoyladenylate synthase [Parvibium lacunae]|uniref:Threonylcarbamoyl-AMP synthase n=1 Tax=Parvibium lacunae TaxID=1888893 RepID=A0A368L7P8_9BURK|nr:L-threonylcarbamoyladenylate synthase [Parvibium lacunae]RCS59646.1 threonylcarbamoyl-AMP synthase [Parvibium lacunae]